ncbi:TetR/AcrR family transcriptional regulator [Legionella fairfieldensis]|uniref:TetR/AcrR family transcriptional regulator n=1 Tax=Legionella fairfieldensis TaxID=45064 RepID=UPI0006862215|nr:TetR/AcrR family transcriptional regulator [Legionella fairfieldensis]
MKKSTKENILNAAKKLFAAHGFSGTSIGAITKLAQVNHSLVFHHFGNKEQLWLAVKQRIVEEANQQTSNLPDSDLSWELCLKELFQRNIAFYRNNSDLIRMLNWQRLEHNTNQTIGVTNSGDMQEWIGLIKHYQQSGDISASLKPEWIVTLILSIISSTALDPNSFIKDEQNYEDYINFCIKSLEIALKP